MLAGTTHLVTDSCGGSIVWIDHGGQLISYYAHLDPNHIMVADGQNVLQGQLIALSDDSGSCTTGAHLHFAIHSGASTWNNGNAFTPEPMAAPGGGTYTGFGAYGAATGLDSPAYTSTTPTGGFNGNWYLKNANTSGGADINFQFGMAGDSPIVGDWVGSGFTTPGVFRQGSWLLRDSNTTGGPDITFVYGNPTDVPIVGDWTGQCKVTPGVFRAGQWYLRNSNSTGGADINFGYGNPTDTPLVGDWTGQCNQSTIGEIDTPGVFRAGQWYLRNSNSAGGADINFGYGNPTDIPLAGDWTNQTTGCPWSSRFDTPGVGR